MKIFTTITILLLIAGPVFSQTQNDTIFNFKTLTPVTIDGQATEVCWTGAEWHAIDQVWIPWNAKMKDGDFSGRFKVAWDEDFLYMLVEVVDDSLSDDHSNVLQNWWDDDCLEVFIDENRSKGNHELSCNAFAYHMSLFYDAVDLNSSGQGVNYKNNVIADMDTIGDNTYLWEFAFKNYDATFNINNPENSRVKLSHNKKMGLTVAYCDNDETTSRENFIGSMVMTPATANDMYKNADHFGLMILQDPDSASTNVVSNEMKMDIKIYPVPAENHFTIETLNAYDGLVYLSISTISGQIVKTETFAENKHSVNINELDAGIYLVKVIQGNNSFTKIISKQ
ncbi:MAG: T9SS type A sorting domain-containing protein [Draconibacterium sp.]|nr:T9SS type A sorting domain-containing protein [Draconibacterium sp.]